MSEQDLDSIKELTFKANEHLIDGDVSAAQETLAELEQFIDHILLEF